KNSTLREFKINIWSLFETSADKCSINQDAVTKLSSQIESIDVEALISVMESNGELAGARVIFADPAGSKPVVNYVFEPLQNDLYVHLQISVTSPTLESENKEIDFYDVYSQLKELGVDYVMVSR